MLYHVIRWNVNYQMALQMALECRTSSGIKSYVSNFYVGMVVGKNGRRYIAIQNVAKIISVVEALYAILTVCLG